ncbi:MAG: hypothetical protein JXR94_18310 [Candidatus Hydrogenedentes bacterium]|nr:hypothetical protein [Candidatus Hydrogenedentota bacterium]
MGDGLKANLNVYAVLQNLEDLVRLDGEMGRLTQDWHEVVQFLVRGGPKAYVSFSGGTCRHGRGRHERPTIKLYYPSAGYLNRAFLGAATPIPVKGLTKLEFLKNGFTELTDRLTFYLKPTPELLQDAGYRKLNTILTLQTALFAVGELAACEPRSRLIAAGIADGVVQVEVLPDGPRMHLVFEGGAVTVAKGPAVCKPLATMVFRSESAANAVLNGHLDTFCAVAEGELEVRGILPMVDDIGRILDRVRLYLS